MHVVLDLPGITLGQAETIFIDLYEEAGWETQSSREPGGGFVPTEGDRAGVTLLFCAPAGRWARVELSAPDPAGRNRYSR